MYKVDFKKRESILLDDIEGFKIKTAFEDNTVLYNQVISIKSKDLSFRKKEIDFVYKYQENTKKYNKVIESANLEEKHLYEAWVKKTPLQKAQRPDFLHIIRKSFKGWNSDLEKKLIEDLKIFFEQNPKRTYGNGDIYLKYIKPIQVHGQISVTGIHILTTTIGNDARNAHYSK